MKVTVLPIKTREDLERAWEVRRAVFILEQGVNEEEEVDGKDELDGTSHVLATQDGQPIGTARIISDEPGIAYIGRVAVLAQARSGGVGAKIMDAAERVALERYASQGKVEIRLSAQVQVLEFYRKRGYTVMPEQYYDARILHQDAVKTLFQ